MHYKRTTHLKDLAVYFNYIKDYSWTTMPYYLYIVRCADKTLYSGITVDLERRISEHNSSKLGAKYTRARRPVKLVYSKTYRNRSSASKAETKIKKLSRQQKLDLIKKSNK